MTDRQGLILLVAPMATLPLVVLLEDRSFVGIIAAALGLNLLLLWGVRPEPTQSSWSMREVARHPAMVVAVGGRMMLVGLIALAQ